MKSLVKLIGVTAISLLPVLVFASEDDEFSLGGIEAEQPKVILYNSATLNLGYVSRDNFQFSQYRDLTDKGGFASGDLIWDKINANRTISHSLDIHNLGLGDQSLDYILRTDSNLRFKMDYSETPLHRNNTGLTPYTGVANMVLPSTWTAGVNTSDFSLSQVVNPIDNKILRKTLNVSVDQMFKSGFKISAMARAENRKGNMLKGMAIYSNAANPQAVVLPAPVDQRTTEVELGVGYDGQKLMVDGKAHYTRFNDKYSEVTWRNPYASGLGVNVDYPNGIGGYATPPDYEMTSLSLVSGYIINNRTRITLDAMTSETKQQDSLTGYTVNPLLVVTTPPPVNAIKGKLKTNMLNVALLARPMDRLSMKLRYRFNERDNQAGRYAWQYVRGDGADQMGPDSAIFNRPLDYQKDLYTIEGKYRLPNNTRLGLTYDFTKINRNYASVSETKEDTYKFTFEPRRHAHFNQRVELTASQLAGSTYYWSRSFFQELAVSLINQIPDDQRWTEHPLLRQYQLANQRAAGFKWNGSWTPGEKWVVQGLVSARAVRFDKSELGLTDVHTMSVNLSAQFNGSDTYNSWVWVGYDTDRRGQMGRDFLGGINKPANAVTPPLPQGSDPTRDYHILQKNESWSAGLGMQWHISDKWSVKTSYTVLNALTRYDVTAYGAVDLVGSDFPNTKNRMQNLKTQLDYSMTDHWLVTFGHEYFRYTDTSWQYRPFGVGYIDKLLNTGIVNPDETVNMFTLSTSYKF